MITKTDFDAKLSSLNRKITANKSKNLLVENELKKLKTFDSSYFIGRSHFGHIKPSATSDNSLTPAVSYYGTKTRVKFTEVV